MIKKLNDQVWKKSTDLWEKVDKDRERKTDRKK